MVEFRRLWRPGCDAAEVAVEVAVAVDVGVYRSGSRSRRSRRSRGWSGREVGAGLVGVALGVEVLNYYYYDLRLYHHSD